MEATVAKQLPEPQAGETAPLFGMDVEGRAAAAREVAEFFRRGKEKRAATDLYRELLLVHLDGSGDGQYATLINGHISVPANPGEKLRVQWNLLRPITANMVRHHTAIPYRCVVESPPDRRARNQARVSQAYGNHVLTTQKVNQVWAEALWMGAPYGHCPVHTQWRHDLSADLYTPLWAEGADVGAYQSAMRPGFADVFAGDPWNTVYNEGAKRNSVHRCCYALAFPTKLLQNRFQGIPGIQDLKGRTDLPSASRFQRAVRRFLVEGQGVHGSLAVDGGFDGEPITILLCDELAPGMDAGWPKGRLTIVALSGVADTEENLRAGLPLLLHQGPLPGGRFSTVRVYPGDSFDDVLGTPWLSDLDQLQVDLNQLATLRRERIRRFARTQLLAQSSSLEDDTLLTVDDAILYYTGTEPKFLNPPQAEAGLLDGDIRDTMETMFRLGGWQAASRGEGKAGDAAAKVVALANADDSIFASANLFIQQAVCEELQIAHGLAKRYMSVPQMIQIVGSDMMYLSDPWVSADDLSDTPPNFRLTQGSASPDAKLQQLLNLSSVTFADGTPLLTREDFCRLSPDPSLTPQTSEVSRIRHARPYAINAAIVRASEQLEQQLGASLAPPQVQMAAQQLHVALWEQFRIEDGDDPQLNLDALDELILDESVSPLARQVARFRRELIAQWQAQMLAYQQMMGGMGMQPAEAGAPPSSQGSGPPRVSGTNPFASGPTSQEFANAGSQMQRAEPAYAS